LVTKMDTREYVVFVMGCDLNEHAMDLRKIPDLKAQYVYM
jgi:G:T-mismatch repair DNA endonuclease (very short patch repair protein)